ncbi:hypothetical protein [Granulicella mallensis]|uniref:hypothetical protein n=1 Tax=Granulicella mallensis TaxID=940614 RepID=UPI0012371044|nr:hypothetical protein [Granulicella mallensis]
MERSRAHISAGGLRRPSLRITDWQTTPAFTVTLAPPESKLLAPVVTRPHTTVLIEAKKPAISKQSLKDHAEQAKEAPAATNNAHRQALKSMPISSVLS